MGKGGGFEREMSKMFSLWWSRKGDDDLFWRTHGSGARATTRSKKGKKTRGQYGDLCTNDSRGATLLKAFTFSFKRGYSGPGSNPSISLQDIADIPDNAKIQYFQDWVKECISHQRHADSLGWLLVVRKDRRRALVFMPMRIIFKFEFNKTREILETTPCVFFRMQKKMKKKKIKKMDSRKYLRWYLKNNAVVFGMRLEDFLRIVSRNDIVDMVRRNKNG